MDVTDLNAYVQLIQDIMGGTLRRNTFTPVELSLLLDLQGSRMRKTAKNEVLRRYLRAVQQQFAADGSAPIRFARFWEIDKQESAHASKVQGTALRGGIPVPV
jgi:hypothetical protein